MPEEKPSTQPAPAPAPPTPPPAPKEKKPEKVPTPKKKGGWFQKIPTDILLSPGGMILVFLAIIIEVIDWIPLPLIDQIIELPLEIMFIVLFVVITKASFKSLIIPFIIERIPLISDILPTWVIRMLV